MSTTSPPEPGVYPDTDLATYLSWRAASNTVLGEMLRSPAHARVKMEEDPTPDTAAQAFGSAVHCSVLEPARFEATYAVEPDVTGPEYEEYARPRATKAYKEELRAMEEEGIRILRKDEMDALEAIQAAVREHPASGVILDGEGPAEASIVWTDPETGAPVKIRPDWIAEDVGAVVDLKTTADAGPESFQPDFFRYRYYAQAWLYLTGCRAAGFDVEHYTILAAEKSPPYATAVYRVRDDVMEWAEKETRPLLDRFAQCLEADEWPAYPSTVQLISLPKWAYDRIEDREARVRRMS